MVEIEIVLGGTKRVIAFQLETLTAEVAATTTAASKPKAVARAGLRWLQRHHRPTIARGRANRLVREVTSQVVSQLGGDA